MGNEMMKMPVSMVSENITKTITYRNFVFTFRISDFDPTIKYKDFCGLFETHLRTEEVWMTAEWKAELFLGRDGFLRAKLTILSLRSSQTNSLETLVEYSVVNKNREKTKVTKAFNVFNIDGNSKDKEITADIADLLELSNSSGNLVPYGTLTINCEMSIRDIGSATDARYLLNRDLGNLLREKIFSDIVLKVGQVKFPVHSTILAARVPFFRALLMWKAIPKVVNIADMDSDVMEELLEYIYTDRVSDPVRTGQRLFEAAERYGMGELAGIIGNQAEITVSHAVRMLNAAHEDSDQKMLRKALKFIKEHNSSVALTKDWKELSKEYPMLILDLFDKIEDAKTKNKSPSCV